MNAPEDRASCGPLFFLPVPTTRRNSRQIERVTMSFNTPYDTLIGARNISTLEQAVRECLAADTLHSAEFANKQTGVPTVLHFVRGGVPQEDRVPYIAHPFGFYDGSRGKHYMIVDLRQFGVMDPKQRTFKVRDHAGARMAISRALLEHHMQNHGAEWLRDLSPVPATAFARTIAQNIAYRYSLDPGMQVILSVYSAYYYYGLFDTDQDDDGQAGMTRMVLKITRATKADANTVQRIIADLGKIHTITEFCEKIPAITGSVSLQKFDAAMLMQLVSHLWFGAFASEIVGVSMEHPPSWLALCYAGLEDATYTRCRLAAIVQDCAKGGEGERYTRALSEIIDTHAVDALLN
jgi:hypothetical protein